jgi:hypothetical protein
MISAEAESDQQIEFFDCGEMKQEATVKRDRKSVLNTGKRSSQLL